MENTLGELCRGEALPGERRRDSVPIVFAQGGKVCQVYRRSYFDPFSLSTVSSSTRNNAFFSLKTTYQARRKKNLRATLVPLIPRLINRAVEENRSILLTYVGAHKYVTDNFVT